MKSTVVDESLSSYKPMYCSREYQASTRLIQQYEKSTLSQYICLILPQWVLTEGTVSVLIDLAFVPTDV